jgi:GntR family transcriptional regulator
MGLRLLFQMDAHSGVPVYRQLMDQIKYYVASGTLAPGDQLPSIRELAQLLTVNPTTIVKAFNELAHETVIELRHGKGAFVTPRAAGISTKEQEKAVRRLARQLAVEASQMGLLRHRLLRIVEEELEEMDNDRTASIVSMPSVSSGG